MDSYDYLGTIILKTATDNNPRQISIEHEYVLTFAKNKDAQVRWVGESEAAKKIKEKYDELRKKHGQNNEKIQTELRKWIKTNQNELPNVTHYDNVDEKGVFHDADVANTKFGGYKYSIKHPITGKTCKIPEKGFRFPEETMKKLIEEKEILFGVDENTLVKPKKRLDNVKDVLRSVIYEDGRASTKRLDSMFSRDIFANPKSDTVLKIIFSFVTKHEEFILDFFAGSGTTGHATLKLNKEDEGNRKFILVEMGQYFDTVLKPRIQKVIFSDNWKNGEPQDNNGFKKQIIKYQSLEQYEDSLNNLKFEQPNTLARESKDYKVKYMLHFEAKKSNVFLNLDELDNPFEYKLSLQENNGIKERNIDLVETFNYIAGIDVKSVSLLQDENIRYVVVRGYRGDNEVVVIWRNKPKGFDPEKDKEYIEKNILTEEYDEIFVNGNSLVAKAKSIDEIFKTKMIEE